MTLEIYAVICNDRCDCGHASGQHTVAIYKDASLADAHAKRLNDKEVAEWNKHREQAIQELEWCLRNDTWTIPSGVFPWINGYSCGVLRRTREELDQTYDRYTEGSQIFRVVSHEVV